MEEMDWDSIISTIRELIDETDEAISTLCELRYLKACIELNTKVMRVLAGLLREAEAKKEISEAAEEIGEGEPEVEEAEEEEEE